MFRIHFRAKNTETLISTFCDAGVDILPVVEVMLDILKGVVPTPLRLYCCIHQSISYETPKKNFLKK